MRCEDSGEGKCNADRHVIPPACAWRLLEGLSRARGLIVPPGSPGRKPGGLRRRRLVRHPAGSRLAACCGATDRPTPEN